MEKRNLGRMSDKSENRFILFEVERLNQLISTINSLAEEIRGIKSDRDDSLLAFHQASDKYWYTQADIANSFPLIALRLIQ